MGLSCDGTSQTNCTADNYNPYVGATSCSACSACRGTCSGNDYTSCVGPGTCVGMTSGIGADYCTLPWFNTDCGDGGWTLQIADAVRVLAVAWSLIMHPMHLGAANRTASPFPLAGSEYDPALRQCVPCDKGSAGTGGTCSAW